MKYICSLFVICAFACISDYEKKTNLKFELAHGSYGRIYIPVTIDGIKMKLSFDTGSSVSIINLNSRVGNSLNTTDPITKQGEIKLQEEVYNGNLFFKNYMTSIGRVQFNHRYLLNGYNDHYFINTDSINGILGMDIIGQYNWLFDLNNNQVQVSNTDSDIYAEKIAGGIKSGLIRIDKHIDTQTNLVIGDLLPQHFIFDKGFVSNIYFNDCFLSQDLILSDTLFDSLSKKPTGDICVISFENNSVEIYKHFIKGGLNMSHTSTTPANGNAKKYSNITLSSVKRFQYMYLNLHKSKLILWNTK